MLSARAAGMLQVLSRRQGDCGPCAVTCPSLPAGGPGPLKPAWGPPTHPTPTPPPPQEYTNKLAAVQGKGDDYEVAAAQIGVEVYSAMNAAIGG